jgi:hypothetical protein
MLQVAVDFCRLLHNQFALLFLDLLDPKVEWFALEHEISKAMGQVVGKARLALHHKPCFTQEMWSLVVDKHRAHCVLLGVSHTDMAKAGSLNF